MQVVLKHSRLKSHQLDSADGHNRRTIPVPNADASKSHLNIRLHGANIPTIELVDRRLQTLGLTMDQMQVKTGKTGDRRNESTVVVEILISASPEFFRPDNVGASGTYDQAALDAWRDRAMTWLKKEFGENLLCVDLHLDETTPHLHVQTIPLIQKEIGGRSSKAEMVEKKKIKSEIEARVRSDCNINGITDEKKIKTIINKEYKKIPKNNTRTEWRFDSSTVDNKQTLERRQTDLAACMADIGLKRGRPSIRDSEDIAIHYQDIHEDFEAVKRAMDKIFIKKTEIKGLVKIDPPEMTTLGIGYMDKLKVFLKTRITDFRTALKSETDRADTYLSLFERCLTQLSHVKRKLRRLEDAVERLGINPERVFDDLNDKLNAERERARTADNKLADYEAQEPYRIAMEVGRATAERDAEITALKGGLMAADERSAQLYEALKGRRPDAARAFESVRDR